MSKGIVINPIELKWLHLTVVGDSPLITHNWDEKVKQEMLDKQMGKKSVKKRKPKDPEADVRGACYFLEDGSYGVRAVSFKSAAVTACTSIGGITKVAARQAFFVNPGEELIKIHGEMVPREDMVRVGMGTADIRYRPSFPNWHCHLKIKYNAELISDEQLAHMFDRAGFGVGICEWRPEKNGAMGMFHIATQEELDSLNLEAA